MRLQKNFLSFGFLILQKNIRFLLGSLTILFLYTFSVSSQAQYFLGAGAQMYAGHQPWGSGAWGGAQGCAPEKIKIPSDLKDELNLIKDMEDEVTELTRDKRDMEKERRRLDRQVSEANRLIDQMFKTDNQQAAAVKEHMTNGLLGLVKAEACQNGSLKEGAAPAVWRDRYCQGSGNQDPRPDAMQLWGGVDGVTKTGEPGKLKPDICTNRSYVQDHFANPTGYSLRQIDNCKDVVENYYSWVSEKKRIESELAAIDKRIQDLKSNIRNAKRDARKLGREYDIDIDEITSADICTDCGPGGVTTTDRYLGLVGTAINAVATYAIANKAINTNTRLGWPTSPYIATGLGLGAAMYGIYGAGFGGGLGHPCGGFGGPYGMAGWPGGNPYMGGAFGYPGVWGPYGNAGGIYNPGCGYWGCGGYPPGFPGGPGVGFPAAGAFGIGVAGAFAGGFQGGFPMAGGPFTGVFAGGGIPMVPMGPGAFPGGFSGAMAPTFNAYPYPMAGGVGFPGYPMMPTVGLGFPGGFQGFPIGANMYGYNQQLAYQAAIAQAQAQDYSARLQLTSRLSSQIMQIQWQIQNILSGAGAGIGGFGGGFVGGGGWLFPTGSVYPYPGATTLPAGPVTDPNLMPVTPSRGR